MRSQTWLRREKKKAAIFLRIIFLKSFWSPDTGDNALWGSSSRVTVKTSTAVKMDLGIYQLLWPWSWYTNKQVNGSKVQKRVKDTHPNCEKEQINQKTATLWRVAAHKGYGSEYKQKIKSVQFQDHKVERHSPGTGKLWTNHPHLRNQMITETRENNNRTVFKLARSRTFTSFPYSSGRDRNWTEFIKSIFTN